MTRLQFSEETLGVQGKAKRRMFYGPGIDNHDLALINEQHRKSATHFK